MSWTNLSHHIFDGINLTKIGYPPSLSVSFWDISHWQYGKVRNYCDWRTDWNVILHLPHLLVSWGSSTLAQDKYIGMIHKTHFKIEVMSLCKSVSKILMHCRIHEIILKTSQELRMLSSVTLYCQVTKIVMNSGSQLSEL